MERDAVMAEIVEIELAMFQSVNNAGGPSACQTRPDAFRLMRRMAHQTHGDQTLQSYLTDLRQAVCDGRNVMTEKYARMDNLIPPLSVNPLLDEIADAEEAFAQEASRLYPHVIERNGHMMRHYLRCELETLSDATLSLYAEEIRIARQENRNLAVERHAFLAKELGHGSLEAYEARKAGR